MTEIRWRKLEELFHAASELEPSLRGAYLDDACAEDIALRRQVESLLLSMDDTGILQNAVFEAVKETATLQGRVGAYEITGLLGEGGMGSVYRARRADDVYAKDVAIKVIRGGIVAPEWVERFRLERQILAQLEHPSIARLLDGGETERGAPYVVMEYVEGTPIDTFCRENKLGLEARLRLFQRVCDAVAYLHRNLIVHRDLKPANILVTPEGIPKLLDFGIAKLVKQDGASATRALTRPADRLLTPEYAGPEQIRGQMVTTATDVYSLGVLLYELVTGHRPYDLTSTGPAEIEQVICFQEPARPSTSNASWKRQLRGDLDNIVAMAMRKEPQRRYGTAAEMADDISRYLSGFPVRARPDTWGYRWGKFARRNAWQLAAALLLVLSIAAGFTTTFRARQRAERRFGEVRELANSFLFEFYETIRDVPGTTKGQALVVQKAQTYLDKLAADAAGDEGLQSELATAYGRVADMYYRAGENHVGSVRDALQNGAKEIALREALLARHPNDDRLRRELAISHGNQASKMAQGADAQQAMPHALRAVALLEQCLRAAPSDISLLGDTAIAHRHASDAARLLGLWPEAAEHAKQALAQARMAAAPQPRNAEAQSALASALVGLGDVLRDWQGYSPQGHDSLTVTGCYQQAKAILDEILRREPGSYKAVRDAANVRGRLGRVLMSKGDLDGALQLFEQARALYESLAKGDPENASLQRSISISLSHAAHVAELRKDWREAVRLQSQSVQLREALLRHDPTSGEAIDDLATGQAALGRFHLEAGQPALARALLQQSTATRESLAARQPQNAPNRSALARAWVDLADASAALGDPAEAHTLRSRALELFTALKKEGKSQQRDDAAAARIAAMR